MDTQNQMRLENYPQCATQYNSQNHMKRANVRDKNMSVFNVDKELSWLEFIYSLTYSDVIFHSDSVPML